MATARQPDGEDHEDVPNHRPNDSHDKNSGPTINGGDDDGEGSASGSPYPSTSRKKRSNKQRVPPASSSSSAALRKRKETDHYSGSSRPIHPLKKKNEDNHRVQYDGDERVAHAIPAPSVPPLQASTDNENSESEEEPFILPPATTPPPTVKLRSPIAALIATNNNPAEASSALTALAVASDSVDIMDPISHLNSTSAVSSTIPRFGSLKSLEAPTTSLASTALTTGANSSRSPSPAVQSDVDASSAEDEPRPTRSKARNGRSAMKGKSKGKAREKNTGVIVNGTEASTKMTTKKGPPPPLNLKIDAQIDELPVIDTTVEDDVNDRSLDDREDVDMDDPEEEQEEEEEEEEELEDEEVEDPEEEQADEEANEVDEEVIDPEGDDDQEQDGADNEDNEEGENGDEKMMKTLLPFTQTGTNTKNQIYNLPIEQRHWMCWLLLNLNLRC